MNASIAVVVADTGTSPDIAEDVLRAARGQLEGTDDIAWVSDREPPGHHDARPVWCAVGAGASRGELYGVGLRWATTTGCDTVAFTDSSTRLEPGWRAAVHDAIARGAVVVGGPVQPGATDGCVRNAVSWAGFLAEYVSHAVPPYVNATGDLSANNVAYRIETVAGVVGPFWKSEVDRDLRAEGQGLELAVEMRASSLRSYSFRDLTVRRAASGRLYGAQAGRHDSVARRMTRVVMSAVLPIVRVARVARTVRGDDELRRAFWRAFVVLLIAETAWSVGEALGYAFPSRPPAGVR